MLPLKSRRRARRRSIQGRLIFVMVGVFVIALLVGGLTQVARQSHSYDVTVNRSLAAQGGVVANESNATSAEVQSLMSTMSTQYRADLQAELDSVVQQATGEATQAARAAGSAADGIIGSDFSTVFTDRALAVSQLRAAVDGLLGMQPLPVAGATMNPGPVAAPALLSSTEATNRIAAAGTLLAQSDALYRSMRQSLLRSAGHARLPASAWVTDAQVWQVGAVATQVDLLASSTSLAVFHNLVLRTVRLSPPALPTVNGSPTGPSVLTPTTNVSVTVVLANLGSVDEPQASVQFTLALQPTGSTSSRTRTAAIATGRSVTLPTVYFTVKPGSTYLLTVAVVLPPAQTSSAGSPVEKVLQIAPAT
jgi:hypothetical protein